MKSAAGKIHALCAKGKVGGIRNAAGKIHAQCAVRVAGGIQSARSYMKNYFFEL